MLTKNKQIPIGCFYHQVDPRPPFIAAIDLKVEAVGIGTVWRPTKPPANRFCCWISIINLICPELNSHCWCGCWWLHLLSTPLVPPVVMLLLPGTARSAYALWEWSTATASAYATMDSGLWVLAAPSAMLKTTTLERAVRGVQPTSPMDMAGMVNLLSKIGL